MRSLWFYSLCICLLTCFDWIVDIIVLIQLTTWHNKHNWIYFIISLSIQIIARCVTPIFPLRYYDYKHNKNKYHISISIILSFLFSPFLQFYHTLIDDKLSDYILYLKPSKSEEWLKHVHFSKFQIWINQLLKLHSINAISHGLFQSLPQMILLQIILLHEEHQYYENEFIWLKFFISLSTLMLLTPIYCNWLYYHQLNGSDHYDIWTFIFIPFAVCTDLLFIHYIMSFLDFHDQIIPQFEFKFNTNQGWQIVASLWLLCFLYVLIIIAVLVSVIFISIIVWIIYSYLFTDDLDCDCGSCNYLLIGICLFLIITPIFIIIIWFCLLFFNMIWLVLLTHIMIGKLPLNKVELWESIIYWIKQYKDLQDLRLRLFCVNYHILKECRPLIQNEINKYHQDIDINLKFKNIRRACNVKSDTIPIWHLFEFGGFIIDRITLSLLVILGPFYLVTRVLMSLLPIIGFYFNHYLFENSVVAISLVYTIWFSLTLFLLPMVVWHFYIWYHIAPGFYNLECHGLFYSYLPENDKICAIKMSYNNVLNNVIINWNNLLEQYFHDNNIVNILMEYLPGSLFIDYASINISDDCQPLTVDANYIEDASEHFPNGKQNENKNGKKYQKIQDKIETCASNEKLSESETIYEPIGFREDTPKH